MKTDVAFIGGRGIFSNYGGVENATREISIRFANKGLIVDVYGVNGTGNKFVLPDKLSCISAPNFFYRFFGQYGQILYAVMNALFIKRPHIAVLFASGPCIFTPILRLGGINVITSLRAIDSARDKWGFLSKLILRAGEYCAWRFSSDFTVNSKEMFECYYPMNQHVKYIPNGASTVSSSSLSGLLKLGIKPNEYFFFSARLDPVKRLHLLIEAHLKLPEGSRIPLVVAGGNAKDRKYEENLFSLADSKIKFLGHISQEELDPFMVHCRAFILPSILEGMSNSLLSAMYVSKPVLVANVPANSVVVNNEPSAMFIPDDLESLILGLDRLATDQNFSEKLGKKMKLIVDKNFNWDKTADSFFSLATKYL